LALWICHRRSRTIVGATENYWPAEISDATDPEPVATLKQQAALLGARTKNAVGAVVKTSTEGGTAYHSLYLKADALGDYLYKLLDIAHPAIGRVGDYPITAQSAAGGEPKPISSQDEFREWLRAQLSSDYVRTALGNLLRYVHEARRASRAG
jgi:hypothetical protein